MSDKKEVRSHFTKVRKAARSDEKDEQIAARLMSLEDIANADTVLMFASFGSEINTWEIAGKLLTAGKKLAYPKCGRGGVMTFHLISGTSDLKAGAYGIRSHFFQHVPVNRRIFHNSVLSYLFSACLKLRLYQADQGGVFLE